MSTRVLSVLFVYGLCTAMVILALKWKSKSQHEMDERKTEAEGDEAQTA